jgi:hypothetical protein
MPPIRKEEVPEILERFGYTSSPGGFADFSPESFVTIDDVSYLDVHADAVRKSGRVPRRPIRIMFKKIVIGPANWKVLSAGELAPGIESKAHDRSLPEYSPWQCTVVVDSIPNGECIREEGHTGEHVVPASVSGGVLCPNCKRLFGTIEECKTHVPCTA